MKNLVLIFSLLFASAVGALAQAVGTWADADVLASRRQLPLTNVAAVNPIWRSDPENLFLVKEAGGRYLSLVDGDRFEVIHRFPLRFPPHGEPKPSPDGRYVYLGSRNGWITKYDLWSLSIVTEIRAGLAIGNLAVSGDGRWVMVANSEPHTLLLFDADLHLVRSYAASSLGGKLTSAASVQAAHGRKSFIVTFKGIPEFWEISVNPQAAPIFDGLVHDYRMGEAIAKPGFLGVRRTLLDEPLEDLFFDQDGRHVLGVTQQKVDGGHIVHVINLDIRRRIAILALPGVPNPGSALSFPWNGTAVVLVPNLEVGVVTVIDLKSWKLVKSIDTPGPVSFLRGHEKVPYAWGTSMAGSDGKNSLVLIDKASLESIKQVLEPQSVPTHFEFTRDGRYALVSLSEIDGALIAYDTRTFKEVGRVPMSTPEDVFNIGARRTRPEDKLR